LIKDGKFDTVEYIDKILEDLELLEDDVEEAED